ncbi:hypothetical protein BGZ50_005544 [Haplosporangium sp. Z 11]|nr:hypothetical protein BGZ50_005544 [Haplosporangium sp. Z 11]
MSLYVYNKVTPGVPTTSVLTSLRKREYQTRQQQLRQGTCRRIGCPPRPREDFFVYDHAIISPSSPDINDGRTGVEAEVGAIKGSNTGSGSSSGSDSGIKTMTSSSSLPLIHPRVTSAVPMTCCYNTDTDLPDLVMDWNRAALSSERRGRKAVSLSSPPPSSSSPSSGLSLGKTLIMMGQAMGFGSTSSSNSPSTDSLAPDAIMDSQTSTAQLGGGGRRMSTPSMPFTPKKSDCHCIEGEPLMSRRASMTPRPNSTLSTSRTLEYPSASSSPALQPLADEANGYFHDQQQSLRPSMRFGYGYRSSDSTVDMVSSRIPTIIAEREYALEGYDKLIVLNVLTGRQVTLGRLDECLEESTPSALSRLANLAKEHENTKLASARFKNLLPISNEDLTIAQEASLISSGRSVLESIGMRLLNPVRRLSTPGFSITATDTNNSANTIATTSRTTSNYNTMTSNTNTLVAQNPNTEAANSSTSTSTSSGIRSLSMNPSRTLLAIGAGVPFQVTIFSVPEFVPIGVMYGHTDLVFSLTWVSDTVLVSGSRDGSMRVWTMGSPVITTLPSVSGPIQARLPVLTRTEDNTKVRDLAYNNGTGQLMTLAAEGFVNLWDRESYTKIFKLKLARTSETVCVASNRDTNLFAVGSLANISIIDSRSSSIVHEAESCDIERDVRWGVRSLDFKSHIITTGGGSGRIGYYDLRAQRYLDGFENGQSKTTFQEIGAGWMNRDTAYAVSLSGFMVRNAVYAMEYDSTGTRLFAAGGPLQLGLCGSTMTFGLEETNRESNIVRIQGVQNVKPFVDVFLGHGHTEIDTARAYCGGDTEKVLGQLESKELRIATKAWPTVERAHGPEHLGRILRESLTALNAKKIDVFYLHQPDRSTPFEDTAKAVDELYREGLFERFGLSNYTSWEVALMHNICKQKGYVLPTVYQGMYNPLARSVVPELLPCLKQLKIAFYAYNPVGGGLLTGKYKFEDEIIEGGRYDPKTAFGNYFRERYWNRLNLEAVQILDKTAKDNDMTLIEATLRWMRHHSGLESQDGIVIGASNLKHLESNLDDLEKGPLPEIMVQAFDQAWDHVMTTSRHYTRAA